MSAGLTLLKQAYKSMCFPLTDMAQKLVWHVIFVQDFRVISAGTKFSDACSDIISCHLHSRSLHTYLIRFLLSSAGRMVSFMQPIPVGTRMRSKHQQTNTARSIAMHFVNYVVCVPSALKVKKEVRDSLRRCDLPGYPERLAYHMSELCRGLLVLGGAQSSFAPRGYCLHHRRSAA